MALYRSIGAALEDDNSGTNPIDVRKDLGGLFIRAGVLPGETPWLVAGASVWTYTLWASSWVTQTATGDGYHLWGNDATVFVGETGVDGHVPAAPGSSLSRIDIIWIRHPSNGENGDGTSAPAAGVTCGTPQSSPTAPAIPAGAFELARNTMTSAATSTASTGNTITQTAPYTAPRGGVVVCRNYPERNALTALATAVNPIYADVAGVLWTCNDATNWRPVPFAQAAGSATVGSSAAALSNTVAVTFPTGRFTVAPEVFAQALDTSVTTDPFLPMIDSITATGFNLRLYRVNGAVWSTGRPVQWHAVQMLSTAAAG